MFALGTALAFAVNALSPRGLRIARNYFPEAKPHTASAKVGLDTSTNTTGSEHSVLNSSTSKHADKLKELGIDIISTEQATALSKDPRLDDGSLVFIDARNQKHFQEGHIPGAYQFDHYRPEEALPTILPVCQSAEEIIIYCTGGDCEDSQFTAIFLRDSVGIPSEKMKIYSGGWEEWTAAKLPIETGERGSGVMK